MWPVLVFLVSPCLSVFPSNLELFTAPVAGGWKVEVMGIIVMINE